MRLNAVIIYTVFMQVIKSDVPVAIEIDARPQTSGEIVVFYKRVKEEKERSLREGRPIFKEVIHMKIIQGADSLLVWDQPVRPQDKEKYAAQWERWNRTNENRIPGTPIEAWPVLSDTQKASIKALNIWTIEQFAALPDSAGMRIMGFNELRKKAQFFVEGIKDAELMNQVRAEADEKLKAQQAQIDALMAQVKLMQEQPKDKPTRLRPGRKAGWNKKPVIEEAPEIQ
jgi:hypothetical protein